MEKITKKYDELISINNVLINKYDELIKVNKELLERGACDGWKELFIIFLISIAFGLSLASALLFLLNN